MKKIHPVFLSLSTGFLLSAAWPPSPLSFLIFIAFLPLLWLAEKKISRKGFFGWTYLSLLIWNGLTTWWMCNATVPGGISAIAANALLMSIPWIGFYNVKKSMGNRAGYVALLLFWLSFEYIHLNWELSWPWLTMGNVFAMHPAWVQWYQYTGTSGGTLWILLINLLVFLWLKNNLPFTRFNRKFVLPIVLILFFPLIISFLIRNGLEKEMAGKLNTVSANIVLVQPNVDPYDEKFVAGKQEAQLQKLIRMSESAMDANTVLVAWPETAVPVQINEDSMRTSYFMAPVWSFLKQHPNVNLLTGVEGFRFYSEKNKTEYSRKIPQTNTYYDAYNSAVLMDSNLFSVYHKSKLVPGAEVLPSFLRFMESWFEKFGGTTGSYAGQKERSVLRSYNHSYNIAPAVCYESIYGEFMSKYVRNGADLIAVITNDGWWGNTAGYRQHENYARLRTIETRRWLIRSANTGVSCLIDPLGNVIDPQPWDIASSIRIKVPVNTEETFYVRNGDLISKAAIIATILLLIWNIAFLIKSRSKHG
ncbi:MAG: apolipoprotein N-acyltransferase [Chitinophagales bacterium]